MPPEDVTLSEIWRRLDGMDKRLDVRFVEMSRSIDARFDTVGTSIRSLEFVHADTYRVEMSAMARRVEELEDGRKWQSRVLVGSLVLPFIVAVLVALVVTGG